MNREEKSAVIEEVAAQIQRSEAVIAFDPTGLTVTQAADLRNRLFDADATLRVVKNRLTLRSADRAGVEPLKELLVGPTALTFVTGDVALAAKALAAFRRESQLIPFKGGTLRGDGLSVEQIESIARLPALQVLQGQFVGVLASPITGLARGLAALISGLAVQLRQIEEQGLVGGAKEDGPGAAPPAAEPQQAAPGPEPPGDPVAEANAGDDQAAEVPGEGAQQSESESESEEG